MTEEIGLRFTSPGAEAYLRTLKEAREAEDKLGAATKQVAQGLGLLDDATKKALKIATLTDRLDAQHKSLNILQRELDQTAKKYGESSTQAERKRLALQKLEAGIGATQRELEALRQATTRTADALDDGAKQSSKFGEVMTGALRRVGEIATNAMLEAAQAVGQFAMDGIRAAGDFEANMNRFASVTGSSIAEAGLSLKDFSDLFLEMGAKTQFSAAQAQEAAINLAKGGLDPAIISAGGLASTLDLAAAGELDLANAAEITAKQYGVWADKTASAEQQAAFLADTANLLAQAANASTVDVEELALGLSQVGGIAKTSGLTFRETVQTMALLAPGFSSASDAGTSFKVMISRLQPTTKAANKAFAEMNLLNEQGKSAFYDSTGAFIGMEAAAQLLNQGLSGMSEAQKVANLQAAFGQDAFRAAALIAEQGAAGFNAMGVSMGAAGTAAEQAAIKNQGFNFAVESLLGSLETFQIVAGTLLLPVLTALINDALIPTVNAFTSLAQGTVDTNTGLGLLAAFVSDFGLPALTGLTTAVLAYAAAQGAAQLATLASSGALTTHIAALGSATAATIAAAAPYAILAGTVGAVVYKYQELGAEAQARVAQLYEERPALMGVADALNSYAQASTEGRKSLEPYKATVDTLTGAHAAAVEELTRLEAYGWRTTAQQEQQRQVVAQLEGQIGTATTALQQQSQELLRQEAASATATARLGELAGAHPALQQEVQLTAEDLKKLLEQLQKTYQEGGEAVGKYAETEASYLKGVEERRATFNATIEKLQAELSKATTEEQRKAIREQIAEAEKGYKDQEAKQAASYAEQQAAQRAHLGQMLIDYTVNQAMMGNIGREEAAKLTEALAEEYGITEDNNAATFLRMTEAIDTWAAASQNNTDMVGTALEDMRGRGESSIDGLIGKLQEQEDTAVQTTQAMEDYAGEYVAKAVDNFVDSRGRAEDLADAVRDIPRQVTVRIRVEADPIPADLQRHSLSPLEQALANSNRLANDLANDGFRRMGDSGKNSVKDIMDSLGPLQQLIKDVGASITDDLEDAFISAAEAFEDLQEKIDQAEAKRAQAADQAEDRRLAAGASRLDTDQAAADFLGTLGSAAADKRKGELLAFLNKGEGTAKEQQAAYAEYLQIDKRRAAETDVRVQAEAEIKKIQQASAQIADPEQAAKYYAEQLRMLQEEYKIRQEIAGTAEGTAEWMALQQKLSRTISGNAYSKQLLDRQVARTVGERQGDPAADIQQDIDDAIAGLGGSLADIEDNLRARENWLKQIQKNIVYDAQGRIKGSSFINSEGKKVNITADKVADYMAELGKVSSAIGQIGQYNQALQNGGNLPGIQRPADGPLGPNNPMTPTSPWVGNWGQGWQLQSQLLSDGRRVPAGYRLAADGRTGIPPTRDEVLAANLQPAEYKRLLNEFVGDTRQFWVQQYPPAFRRGVTDFAGGLAYVHKGELLANLPRGTDVYTPAETRRMVQPAALPLPQPMTTATTTYDQRSFTFGPTYTGPAPSQQMDYATARALLLGGM